MKDKFLNFLFPVGGGSAAAAISGIGEMGEMAIQAIIFALVGGIVGWLVKYSLDRIFKKKK